MALIVFMLYMCFFVLFLQYHLVFYIYIIDIQAQKNDSYHLFVRLYLGKPLKEELLRSHIRAGICSLFSYRQQEITLYWPHNSANEIW